MNAAFSKHAIKRLMLLAVCLVFSVSTGSGCIPDKTTQTSTRATFTTPGIITIDTGDLPAEARTTLRLIKYGGPFPYDSDGGIFNNFEEILPKQPEGYYHEFTVITPGSPDRGARRIVAGENDEYYYTDDHYKSFCLIME